MTFYDRDPSVPFWRSNVDIQQLYEAHAHRPERAQAWLEWLYVSEQATFEQAVLMRGRFELGLLGHHIAPIQSGLIPRPGPPSSWLEKVAS